jgi:hypothetical protein
MRTSIGPPPQKDKVPKAGNEIPKSPDYNPGCFGSEQFVSAKITLIFFAVKCRKKMRQHLQKVATLRTAGRLPGEKKDSCDGMRLLRRGERSRFSILNSQFSILNS